MEESYSHNPGAEISAAEVREFQNVYSPGTLLGVYAAAMRTSVEGRLVLARGVFQASAHSRVYGDFFYDSIKSVYENKAVKAKIPALLRNKLENNQVYLFKGYIEKKIAFSSIELQLVVDEVLQKEENQVSPEEIKRFRLIQQRITKGTRDLESLVKDHVYRGQTIRIANVYGNMAIVHKDFEKGLGELSTRFHIVDMRCNMSSKAEILQCLNSLSGSDFQAVALVRGGGDPSSLEIFNDPEIGSAALKLQPLFITALGHTVNETLLDKLADRNFALPHDYGNSLKVYVENAVAEQARSRTLFIEQVKADLTKTFHDQILTLRNQLETKNKEYSAQEEKFKELLLQNQKDKTEALRLTEEAHKSQLAALAEQLKSKEESLKNLAESSEQLIQEKIKLAVSESTIKYMQSEQDRSRLQQWRTALALLILVLLLILTFVTVFR